MYMRVMSLGTRKWSPWVHFPPLFRLTPASSRADQGREMQIVMR
jgi:hypothetical protein